MQRLRAAYACSAKRIMKKPRREGGAQFVASGHARGSHHTEHKLNACRTKTKGVPDGTFRKLDRCRRTNITPQQTNCFETSALTGASFLGRSVTALTRGPDYGAGAPTTWWSTKGKERGGSTKKGFPTSPGGIGPLGYWLQFIWHTGVV